MAIRSPNPLELSSWCAAPDSVFDDDIVAVDAFALFSDEVAPSDGDLDDGLLYFCWLVPWRVRIKPPLPS